MRKTDKKREKQLIKLLNEACNQALEDYPGFQWLTHTVNYSSFPDSLSITCVFDTRANLATMLKEDGGQGFTKLLCSKLAIMGIKLKQSALQVHFDTEEQCLTDNQGKWKQRLH